jgi:hypothetical protein
MAEAEVSGIFQAKFRLCSGWPPPPNLTLAGVDCFVLYDQQIGSHRYAVTFFFFESAGAELEESLKTAEEFQRQWTEFQKLEKNYPLPGTEPPNEAPTRPAVIKRGKKLSLIAFFAQDVDDQIGSFRDLHNDLVNSYGQPTDKTDESDDARLISRERWLRGGAEIRLGLLSCSALASEGILSMGIPGISRARQSISDVGYPARFFVFHKG